MKPKFFQRFCKRTKQNKNDINICNKSMEKKNPQQTNKQYK